MAGEPFPLEPGTTFVVWRPAGMITVPGKPTVTQRFTPDAWTRRVGQVTLLYLKGEPVGAARLHSAVVAADGSGVNLTYQVLGIAA